MLAPRPLFLRPAQRELGQPSPGLQPCLRASRQWGWQARWLHRGRAALRCPPAVQGIFSAATYIHCNTRAALEEAARRCPGWPVLLTGHSLGGGVAALLTLLLREAGLPEGLGPVRCITIGTGEWCREMGW